MLDSKTPRPADVQAYVERLIHELTHRRDTADTLAATYRHRGDEQRSRMARMRASTLDDVIRAVTAGHFPEQSVAAVQEAIAAAGDCQAPTRAA